MHNVMRQSVIFRIVCQGVMFIMLGVAACWFADSAKAKDLGYLQNQAGGEIVFTDVVREGTIDLVCYARHRDGTVLKGTWIPADRAVMVTWDDGRQSMYAYDAITVIKPETSPAAVDFRL